MTETIAIRSRTMDNDNVYAQGPGKLTAREDGDTVYISGTVDALRTLSELIFMLLHSHRPNGSAIAAVHRYKVLVEKLP